MEEEKEKEKEELVKRSMKDQEKMWEEGVPDDEVEKVLKHKLEKKVEVEQDKMEEAAENQVGQWGREVEQGSSEVRDTLLALNRRGEKEQQMMGERQREKGKMGEDKMVLCHIDQQQQYSEDKEEKEKTKKMKEKEWEKDVVAWVNKDVEP